MHLETGISATSAQIWNSIWCQLRNHTLNADVRAPSPHVHALRKLGVFGYFSTEEASLN